MTRGFISVIASSQNLFPTGGGIGTIFMGMRPFAGLASDRDSSRWADAVYGDVNVEERCALTGDDFAGFGQGYAAVIAYV
jgi:hypothetical protein